MKSEHTLAKPSFLSRLFGRGSEPATAAQSDQAKANLERMVSRANAEWEVIARADDEASAHPLLQRSLDP